MVHWIWNNDIDYNGIEDTRLEIFDIYMKKR